MSWRDKLSAYAHGYMMAFDLWPEQPRMPVLNAEESLRRDWEVVMGDLQRAINQIRKEDDLARRAKNGEFDAE